MARDNSHTFARAAHARHGGPSLNLSQDRYAPGIALRDTGIRLLGDVPWGTHLCLFWETKQDLLDANIAWIKAGLEAGEYCLWIVSEPITIEEAAHALQEAVPHFGRHARQGKVEILATDDWYLPDGKFEPGTLIRTWHRKCHDALGRGHEGLWISGNAVRELSAKWKKFCDYEHMLDESVASQPMLVLCTYSLATSSARDVLDVARAHQYSIARRDGAWELLEVPIRPRALNESRMPDGNLDELPHHFSGHELLTPKESIVLAQIVSGASSKQAARKLKISPRTVEFHRANIMRKAGVKSTIELVRRAMGRD